MDVGTLVARSTRKYRDRIAVESSEGAMTFGELGSKENPVKRLLSRIPVSGIIHELPKPWNTD